LERGLAEGGNATPLTWLAATLRGGLGEWKHQRTSREILDELRFQFTLAGSSLVLPYHTLLVVFNLVRNRESNIRFIPFGGTGDLFSAQASPPKTLGVVRGLLNNHQK
jgi:hypothetical protein